MTIGAVQSASSAASAPVTTAGYFGETQSSPLPEPTTFAAQPTDLLGMMMALSDEMSRSSMNRTEAQLLHNQDALREAFKDFSAKMAEALRKADEAAKKHDNGGGFFGFVGDIVDAVCDFVGKVVGTVVGTAADFVYDLVTAPLDIIKGVLSGDNLQQLLTGEFSELTHNGSIAQTAQDCAKGVMSFAGELVKFGHSLVAVMEAGIQGKDVGEVLKARCEAVLGSFKEDILNNPAVMKVVGLALKVVAIAAAVVTCGALAVVAVGLLILGDLDKRFGIAEAACGKEAGQWVSLGIQVAAAVCLAVAGGVGGVKDIGDTAALLKDGAAVLSAVATAALGVEGYLSNLKRADEADAQANITEALNRMNRLQRLIDGLLEEYGEQVENQGRTFKAGAQLYQTQGATMEAAVIRA